MKKFSNTTNFISGKLLHFELVTRKTVLDTTRTLINKTHVIDFAKDELRINHGDSNRAINVLQKDLNWL